MELKQQLRLTQQLVMTPQLQQAIRLLQLSRLELQDEIRKELDDNPILSDEPDAPSGAKGQEPGPAAEERTAEAAFADEYAPTNESRESEKAAREVDWEKFLENRSMQGQQSGGVRSGYDDLPPIEQNLTKPNSLKDHMMWQLQLGDFTEEERRFGELVIGNLDDKGYLDLAGVERADGTRTPDLTIEDLAEEAELHPEDAPYVLEMIQQFDPLGVAARNLRECLIIQARAYGYDEIELRIIEEHLPQLERHNYQAIARDLKIPVEDVYEAAKEIQKLESRPARNFSEADDRTIGITPDVHVIRDGDEFVVLDSDRGTSRLHINETLTQKLLKDPSAKEFVGEKLRNAQWLIRAIEQRRKTIIRVSECIVEKQRDFFEKGVGFLKPMILRDVAEAVGMHESTISRVTTNKYMHTPQGLFELKYFFNSSIRRVANEDIASESVKQAIKKMIEAEDKANPLSDQAIVELLKVDEGIKIARRTVAKYREMLGILASSKRKKLFWA
jgi:RNA polymerase sigma-54 factor